MFKPRTRNAFWALSFALEVIVLILVASGFGALGSPAHAAQNDELPSLLDKWRRCRAAGM